MAGGGAAAVERDATRSGEGRRRRNRKGRRVEKVGRLRGLKMGDGESLKLQDCVPMAAPGWLCYPPMGFVLCREFLR